MVRALVLAYAILLTACVGAPPPARVLRVASDLDNRPFAWVDEHNQVRGRDVEMMQLLARELDRELVWRRMPFEELLPACERGEIDVVCATLGVTAERARCVRITRAYFATEIRVVVRAGANEPSSLAELAGRRVAASPGTTSEYAVRARLPSSSGVFEGSKDAGPIAQRLLSRSIDAAVMDGPAADALVVQYGGTLEVLGESLASELYALALPMTHANLCSELDALLERLEPDLRALDARFELTAANARNAMR